MVFDCAAIYRKSPVLKGRPQSILPHAFFAGFDPVVCTVLFSLPPSLFSGRTEQAQARPEASAPALTLNDLGKGTAPLDGLWQLPALWPVQGKSSVAVVALKV